MCAFDFDTAATVRLLFFDLERDKRQTEAIAEAGMMAGLNGGGRANESLREITPANFGDQKF